MTELEALRAKVAAYDAAAEKFIAKVDSGQARSVETYHELSRAYLLPKDGLKHKLTPTGDAQRDRLVAARLHVHSDSRQ